MLPMVGHTMATSNVIMYALYKRRGLLGSVHAGAQTLNQESIRKYPLRR
eukprot:COSAG02_NODE_39074_length_421_cov_0.996894_2_plen_48_part_01